MLLNDRMLYNSAAEATASLRNISGKIERGEGTLGSSSMTMRSTRTKSAVSNVNDGMKDVKEIAAKINRGEGTIGKLVNDDSLYTEFRDASHNVKEITRKISEGEGTLGKLVNEDKMYRDATATLKKTEKAMEGLGDSGPISVLGSIIGSLF